jgi:hypothetical protein
MFLPRLSLLFPTAHTCSGEWALSDSSRGVGRDDEMLSEMDGLCVLRTRVGNPLDVRVAVGGCCGREMAERPPNKTEREEAGEAKPNKTIGFSFFQWAISQNRAAAQRLLFHLLQSEGCAGPSPFPSTRVHAVGSAVPRHPQAS